MREIKFRVWCKEYEQFIQFNKMRFLEDGSLWYVQGVDENEEEINPPYFENQNDWELMQYTGLKDKNGVEIYEGDFLMAGDAYLGVIEYHSTRAQFIGKNIGETFPEDEYDTLYTKNGRFNSAKVIGNIYENPKLLEREGE